MGAALAAVAAGLPTGVARARAQVEAGPALRAQVLQQAGTAMLAQANQMPQSVLKLLQ